MKTIALTFSISSLFLGILFFAYQASDSQAPKWNTPTRAIAVALGATDKRILQQQTEDASNR